ncbi:unnamed protein product [Diamesa hyperborea]
MAPKNPAKSSKKASNDEDSTNEDYRLKRDRNNLAVRRSRNKSKQKAEETANRVGKLKQNNSNLEGKIIELKKTKKILKDLFLEQTTKKLEKPTTEQWALINEQSESEESDPTTDEEDLRSEPESPTYSTSSNRSKKRR